MEIELKYLIQDISILNELNLVDYDSYELEQYYMSLRPEMRYRKLSRNGIVEYYYTEKSEGSLSREETERLATEEEYELNKVNNLYGENTILKDRYKIPYKSYILELDVYKGMLEGLIMCEVEFESELEVPLFQAELPLILQGAKDVTELFEFKNKNLLR